MVLEVIGKNYGKYYSTGNRSLKVFKMLQEAASQPASPASQPSQQPASQPASQSASRNCS
jgi:hypothetical protein